jgi:hypothetical protein
MEKMNLKGKRDVVLPGSVIDCQFDVFWNEKTDGGGFLDISDEYDNFLINVLCGVMLDKELPLEIFQVTTFA